MKNLVDVRARLLEIGKMAKPELVRLWMELYGTAPPKQGRRDFLVRFVAYRFQEQTLGGLSHKTKNRLLQLAQRIEKDPKTDPIGAPQIKPGTCLVRDWRGKPHRVLVLVSGYEYAGKKYASLSEIARLITGGGLGHCSSVSKRLSGRNRRVDKPRSFVRCAVYTRKSSEEGLEQSFNSLDAQREACDSFIASQKHEGWHLFSTHYDDGGFSGGTMERPALKKLLDDLQAGRIDTVVVYKVDRLTRALSDFAKIIEIFDAHKVSFVSVTQQFNTTTSMGRLTLNVLLSFAQFEREVTGERIRDKIAASKKKGMWMGGTVPLGYDVKHRKLIVNQREANAVREIYRRYLDLGCVSRLKLDLEQKGVRSKQRVSQRGTKSGGAVYSRGALYKILQNRMYIGEIDHRGQVYSGEQPGIVPRELWERVQKRLDSNNNAHRNRRRLAGHSLLAGFLFDECGNRFTPSHTNKNGKRYRYYVSQAAIKNPGKSHSNVVRIPAGELEHLVCSRLRCYFASSTKILESIGAERPTVAEAHRILSVAQRLSERLKDGELNRRLFLQSVISKAVVHSDNLKLVLRRRTVEKALGVSGAAAQNRSDRPLQIKIPFRFERSQGATRIIPSPGSEAGLCNRPVPSLVKAIARSYDWYDRIVRGELSSIQAIAKAVGCNGRYVRKILPFAFLAPSLVESILNGQQPPSLTLSSGAKKMPADWAAQAEALRSA